MLGACCVSADGVCKAEDGESIEVESVTNGVTVVTFSCSLVYSRGV